MHHSHDEGLSADAEQAVSMRVFVARMQVNVSVRLAVFVAMNVRVNLQSALSHGAPGCAGAKRNKHECNRHLEPRSRTIWYGGSQEENNYADSKQRSRVSESPERSDERRARNTLMLAYDRGDRYKMIRVKRVAKSQNEPQSECCSDASIHLPLQSASKIRNIRRGGLMIAQRSWGF
jgi:hypothetical protein